MFKAVKVSALDESMHCLRFGMMSYFEEILVENQVAVEADQRAADVGQGAFEGDQLTWTEVEKQRSCTMDVPVRSDCYHIGRCSVLTGMRNYCRGFDFLAPIKWQGKR